MSEYTPVNQFTEGLDQRIKNTGCAVLSCIEMARRYTPDVKPEIDDINVMVSNMVDTGVVADNLSCWGQGGGFAGCTNFALRYFGSSKECRWVPTVECTDTLICMNTGFDDVGGQHWMLGDCTGNVTYDPALGTIKPIGDTWSIRFVVE